MKKQFSVAKFGGTSVGNIKAIGKCVEIINKDPNIKAIVVSAQAGVTNLLAELIVSDINSYKPSISKIYKIISPIIEHLSLEEADNTNSLFKEWELLCQKTILIIR